MQTNIDQKMAMMEVSMIKRRFKYSNYGVVTQIY